MDVRVETHQFKVVVIKRDKVLAPLALIGLNHTIALILNFVLGNDLVAETQQFPHLKLSLFRAEGIVVNIGAVLCHKVKVADVALAKLLHVLCTHANNSKRALK